MGGITYPRRKPKGAYVYRFTVDGVVRYIGLGIGDRYLAHERAASAVQVRHLWHRYLRSVLRRGMVVVCTIARDGLERDDAAQLEKDLITRHGRRIIDGGTLMNINPGGDGWDSETARLWMNKPEVKAAQKAGYTSEVRASMSASLRKAMARPETKARLSKAQREINARPEIKAAQSERMTAFFSDARNRIQLGRKVSATKGTAEARAAVSSKSREQHARPEVKARHSRKVREALARAESKARQRAAAREINARPEVRAKLAAFRSSEEGKAAVVRAGLAAWQGESGRKLRARAKSKMNQPHVKAKLSASNAAAWQDPAKAKRTLDAQRKARELRIEFCRAKGITSPGKGFCTIDPIEFARWVARERR